MKKTILLIASVTIITTFLHAKPTKMIFIEQIYKLYESNLHSPHTNHKRNIVWLENSLKLPNIHPSMAIIITNTWEEYVKYKILLRFHIHFLLTKEYVAWGWEFDKRNVTFYNIEWAEELKKSFEIAKLKYETALHYWHETKKWSAFAYEKPTHIGWEKIEDLNWQIENDEFDYDYEKIISMRLAGIEKKMQLIDDFLKTNQ